MILIGDSLQQLATIPDASVHCCVTSPPYFGLRDYGMDGQIGLEATPDAFVARLVEVFREVRRVLRDDGTLWLNLGDSYAANRAYQVPSTKGGLKLKHGPAQGVGGAGSVVPDGLKPKDLIGIPWRVAFALQADGYYLRQDIIWSKPNPMPESVTDRCTKAHEYIFMLSKSARYFYDAEAVKEPAVSTDARKFTDGGRDKQRGHGRRHAGFNGRYADKIALEGAPATRNRRSVWTVATKPFKEAHFATFPPDLIEPCILAGCPVGGTVLDPFFGAGTTGLVAQNNGRKWIGIELNPEYAAIAKRRLGLLSDPLHLWMTAA
jgi:DNA modification methylase